jgi:hypothetical protein
MKDLPAYLMTEGVNQTYLLSRCSSEGNLSAVSSDVLMMPDAEADEVITEISQKLKVSKDQCIRDLQKANILKGKSESKVVNNTLMEGFTSPVVVLFALISDQRKSKAIGEKIKNEKDDVKKNPNSLDKTWSLKLESYVRTKKGGREGGDDDGEEGVPPSLNKSESDAAVPSAVDILIEEEEDEDIPRHHGLDMSVSAVSKTASPMLYHATQSWQLGFACNKSPAEIMKCVYTILRNNSYEWKNSTMVKSKSSPQVNSVYSLVCRFKEQNKKIQRKEINGGVLVHPVEIGIDLFKTPNSPSSSTHEPSSTNSYCLDLKRVKGDGMSFMAMSCLLLSKLTEIT